ncbi:Uncharacterised protein [Xylophilus ampelinus]|nr:Uncharacterised protein [Xylophilus ampelinus]
MSQGSGAVAAKPSIPEHQLARSDQRHIERSLCGRAGTPRWRQYGQGTPASRAVALIEWPAGDAEPSKYFLSTLPEDTPINDLVDVAHQRWRIERDYQDLTQDFGLGHYEGRGWRDFHHHAALSIAACGLLMAERLVAHKSVGGEKSFIERKVPALSKDYIPRGSPARTAPRGDVDQDTAPSTELPADRSSGSVHLLRKGGRKTTYDTVGLAQQLALPHARHPIVRATHN